MFSVETFLLIISLAAAPAAEGHQPQSQNGQNPTAQQAQVISEFYKKCLRQDAGTITIVGPSKTQDDEAYGLIRARVLGVSGKADNLDIRPEDGVPLIFSRPGRIAEPGTEGRTHKDAIGEPAAWEAALPVLAFYGLPVSRKEYVIEMRDRDSREGNDDLYGAEWHISKQLQYKGMPCRQCQISISVSAVSGKIFLILYTPVIVPPDVERKISKSAAVDSARAWLKARKYFAKQETILGQEESARRYFAKEEAVFGQEEADRIKEVVARPNDAFIMEGEPGFGSRVKGAFLCWEVPFLFAENGVLFPASIWVRVDTGEVVGAWNG